MNQTWLAIQREASLAAEHLAAGVTLLGKANYAYQSRYYQAFFALSVGLERSAKLAIAVDEYLRTGEFPSERDLRNHGHKLDQLLRRMDAIARGRGLTREWTVLPDSPIHQGILGVLSDFASNITRYYNLDLITGAARITGVQDPLQAWHDRVFTPVSNLHYTDKRRAKVEANAQLIEDLFGPFSMVRHHSETGSPVTDLSTASALTGQTEVVQPYVRMYVMQVARFVACVMSELGHAATRQGSEDVPYLSEFYGIFYNDDTYFRGRKTWSTHPG